MISALTGHCGDFKALSFKGTTVKTPATDFVDSGFPSRFCFVIFFHILVLQDSSLHLKQPVAFRQPGIVDMGKLVHVWTTSLLLYAFLVFGESLVDPCPRSATGEGYNYSLTLTHSPFLCLSQPRSHPRFYITLALTPFRPTCVIHPLAPDSLYFFLSNHPPNLFV